MAPVTPEQAMKALGVHPDLHEPLTALLDALRAPGENERIIQSQRDELEAIDREVAEAGFSFPRTGHRGVRDVASQLRDVQNAYDELKRQFQEMTTELRSLRNLAGAVARILEDFGLPEGTKGLWKLAAQYEDLRDREPSFAEVNQVMIEAGVGSVGLDGVKGLINYRDWAKGVFGAIDAKLVEAGMSYRGSRGVEELLEAHLKLVKDVEQAARLDLSKKRAPCPLWSIQVPHSEHMWDHDPDGWVHCPGFSPSFKPV